MSDQVNADRRARAWHALFDAEIRHQIRGLGVERVDRCGNTSTTYTAFLDDFRNALMPQRRVVASLHGALVMMIQQKDNEGRHVELSGTAKRSRDGKLRLFINVYSSGNTANLIFTSIGLSKEDQDQLVKWIHESEEEHRAE